MFEATIDRSFSAAHALRLPDGALEPMHGHNWAVAVTVTSSGLDAMDTVMDFHELERLVEAVIGPWHNRVLNDVEPFFVDGALAINPSTERVAQRIALALADRLPEGVALRRVSVGEAPGCTAHYCP